MGKLFWIACGVGLLAAAVLWFGVTGPVQKKVSVLHKELDAQRTELINWSTAGPLEKTQLFGKIVNQSFINVERAYKASLADTKALLYKQMRGENMSLDRKIWVDSEGGPPPMDDVAAFREWLTDRYEERNAKLREEGVGAPDDSISMGDVADWANVTREDLPFILREYRISREVFDALAEASAEVKYVATVKNPLGVMEPHESEATRKVIAIEALRFARRDDRRGRPRTNPGRQNSLLKEHVFVVKISAHHGPAIDFIRRLEGSKAGVFVVRTVEVTRVDRLKIMRRETPDEPNPYRNDIDVEAPVTVNVTVSLLEFIGK